MNVMSNDKRVVKGVPTGGEFAARNRTESASSLAARERELEVRDLGVGDVIIGASGARLTISNIERSSFIKGSYTVENEFGTLYLDGGELVTVAAADDRSWTVYPGARLPHDAIAAVVNDALDRGQIAGSIFTRDSVESQILNFTEETPEFSEDEAFFIENHSTNAEFINDVFEVVTESHGWGNLGDGSYEESAAILESEVVRAIRIVATRPR